jgi:uncharacterized membrane protein YfcA
VVFFNALSGSIAYARLRRIDYRTGLIFASATVPGAVLGALATQLFSRGIFNVFFGTLLLVLSTFIFLCPKPALSSSVSEKQNSHTRTVVDCNGVSHTYCFDIRLGLLLSFGVGFMSSLLGIGGGIIHVPALMQLLNFPPHIATATSHFMLAIMAFAGTVVHILTGEFSTGIRRTAFLAIGVLAGAQLGAKLSNKIKGTLLLRLLAVALFFVGLRLIFISILGRH